MGILLMAFKRGGARRQDTLFSCNLRAKILGSFAADVTPLSDEAFNAFPCQGSRGSIIHFRTLSFSFLKLNMNVFLSHIRKQCVCTLQCALTGGQIDGAWSSRRKKVKTLPVKFIILFYVCINYECEATGSKKHWARKCVWRVKPWENTHENACTHRQRLIRRKNKKHNKRNARVACRINFPFRSFSFFWD